MSEYDDENFIADDFYSLINGAQINELQEVERKREAERDLMRQLDEERRANEGGKYGMSLTQIAGLQSQKELDALAAEKNAAEEKRSREEELKRKETEHAKLVNQFPPPDLKHNS